MSATNTTGFNTSTNLSEQRIENCLQYVYKQSTTARLRLLAEIGGSRNSYEFRCISCKPGYIPNDGVYSDEVFFDGFNEIHSCRKIENCEDTKGDTNTGKILNACDKCSPGYVYGYEASNSRLRIDKCVKHDKADNCFAKEVISDSDTNCILCKKGSELINGDCIERTVPLCNSFQPEETFDRPRNNVLV